MSSKSKTIQSFSFLKISNKCMYFVSCNPKFLVYIKSREKFLEDSPKLLNISLSNHAIWVDTSGKNII